MTQWCDGQDVELAIIRSWVCQGFKKPRFFRKPSPVGFLRFIGFWVLGLLGFLAGF